MSNPSFFRKQAAFRRAIAETLETRAYLTAVSFAAPLTIPISNPATTAVLSNSVTADFNGDGFVDFATLNSANRMINVMLNNGDGTFRPGQSLPTGRQPDSLQAVALSNGNVDLLFVNSVDATAEFFTGNGDGKFNTTPVTFSVGTAQPLSFTGTVTPDTIDAADINGDGLPDIVVGTSGGALISRLNTGNGQFAQSRLIVGGLSATGKFINAVNSTNIVNALPNGAMQIFVNLGSGLASTARRRPFRPRSPTHPASIRPAMPSWETSTVTETPTSPRSSPTRKPTRGSSALCLARETVRSSRRF